MDNKNEESSSSSGESDSETSQTSSSESEGRSNVKGGKDISPTISLSCFRKWDEKKLERSFQQHVSNMVNSRPKNSLKVGSGKISNVDNFIPWWNDFSKSTNKTESKNIAQSVKADPDAFDNWFDKSKGDSSANWLCGPGSSSASTSQQKPPVEDIEVPSIYDQVPQTKGRRAQKRERKAEREKTLGKKWFEMRAPDVDEDMRNDMEMIRMRGILDPKRFYKHNDRRALPKYFQMGTVVDEGTDFYSSRLTKKQRKKTLVEELMADANVRQYNKRKYSEVQQKMRNKSKVKGQKASKS